MNFIKKISSKKAILFCALYFSTFLNISFWKFVFDKVDIVSFGTACFFASLFVFIFLPLYWLFNLILVPKVGKSLVFLLFILASGTNYMMYHYGIYIDKNMIQNVFETNPREAFDLFTPSLLISVFFFGVVPGIFFLFTKIEFRPFMKELKQRTFYIGASFLILLILILSLFKDYAAFGRNNREVKGLINIVNVTAGTLGYVKKLNRKNHPFVELDKDAKHIGYVDDLHTVFIFVLGETARSHNFSIYGYNRKTNPLLEKQDILHFKNMTSCGTATAVSVPCIFSNMTHDDFDSSKAKYTENLLDLLQASGYKIVWRENDNGCKGVCDRIKDTKDVVKEGKSKYCNKDYCFDDVLLEELKKELSHITQDTVIVLHTMGSHGPTYYKRYPKNFEKFKPSCETADIQNCPLDKIVNTYDNTILYTDYIVSSAIDLLKAHPQYESGLIYVSDHGESLGENNIFLHGMPYAIAPKEQTEIPMVLYLNENMKKYDYLNVSCLKEHAKTMAFSHDNLFHSILGLLEVKSTTYKKDYDLFDKCRLKPLPYETEEK
ncbi:MAG: phosphoethanolamine--lipid A transferase [Alphaproteobacteria bacterium]|nr:phosphoethanolamine--lipid A transferase [Alphaproteobacteria bacterium]